MKSYLEFFLLQNCTYPTTFHPNAELQGNLDSNGIIFEFMREINKKTQQRNVAVQNQTTPLNNGAQNYSRQQNTDLVNSYQRCLDDNNFISVARDGATFSSYKGKFPYNTFFKTIHVEC
jgi:hypothetical protein